MKKVIVAVIILVLGAGLAVYLGFFPIAKVNGKVIWYRDLSRKTEAFETFKRSLEALAVDKDAVQYLGFKGIDVSDVEIGFFMELFEQTILDQAIKSMDGDDIKSEAESRTKDAVAGADKDKLEGVANLYGMDFKEYKKRYLIPYAIENVVIERVEANGEKYGEWFKEKLASADVSIYFLPYEWVDGALKRKE